MQRSIVMREYDKWNYWSFNCSTKWWLYFIFPLKLIIYKGIYFLYLRTSNHVWLRGELLSDMGFSSKHSSFPINQETDKKMNNRQRNTTYSVSKITRDKLTKYSVGLEQVRCRSSFLYSRICMNHKITFRNGPRKKNQIL